MAGREPGVAQEGPAQFPALERPAIPLGLLLRALMRSIGTVVITLAVYGLAPLETEAARNVAALIAVLALALIGVVFAWQLSRVSHSAHPVLAAVEALVLVFGMFLTLFATIYVVQSGSDPDAFTQPMDRVAGIYFSVTVLATVGFGDISALSHTARITVTIQMLLDLVLIGAVVKLLAGSARRAMASGQASSASPPTQGDVSDGQ